MGYRLGLATRTQISVCKSPFPSAGTRLRQHPRGVWRKAKVIAVEKPGKDPSLAANYRTISLLNVCYKLLERLALQHISPTVKGLLSPDQTGFRKGRSTCYQVAALTTFIENGFQQNLKTGAVFLDLTLRGCGFDSQPVHCKQP